MSEQSEFKKKEKIEEDKDENSIEKINEFGREQTIHTCQFCLRRILTEIEHETTWIGIGISVILFMIFQLYSIPLILLLIPLTQQTIHTCPNCLNKVGTRSFFDLISLTDKVITYRMGSFAIIITKKQILAVFIFMLFGICFYLFFSNFSINRGNFIEDTWSDFNSTCGQEKLSSANHEVIETICNEKYKYSDVSWNGYVIRIDYHENFFAKYRLSLLIKVQESNKDNEDPDFYLNFHDYIYERYKHDVFNITRGDLVSFNSTIVSIGSRKSIPMLEAFEFEKMDKHIELHPHIHHRGRYSVEGDKDINKGDVIYGDIPNLISDEEIKMNQLETDH